MRILLFLLILFADLACSANLIRDAEIETVLKQLASPVIIAAKLNPEDINIYVVADNNINAFVSSGSNIFINSGLLIGMNDPDAIIAVIAHELGHITQHHVIRDALLSKEANKFMIGSFLLAGISAYAGSGDLAMAILGTGAHINERTILKYSREFEESADKAAMSYLDKSYNSSIGLLRSFNYFNQFLAVDKTSVNPYAMTHPLTDQRLQLVKTHLINNSYISNLKNIDRQKFIRIVVKLKSFLSKPNDIFNIYKASDLNSLYARSIAFYKLGDIDNALKLLKIIFNSEPENLYLKELFGQFYFENGQIDKSIDMYSKAIGINSALVKIELANSLIANYDISNNNENLKNAINLLNTALLSELENPMIFKSLAIAYGKLNDIGRANLYLSNEMILYKNWQKAKFFADKSIKYFELDSDFYAQANEIIETSILQLK